MNANIRAGSGFYLGAPARPMDPRVTQAVVELVASFADVVEAHLPQCWVPGTMNEAAQVLILVFSEADQSEHTVNRIGRRLSELLPPASHLDIWSLTTTNSLLDSVRATGCCAFNRNGAEVRYSDRELETHVLRTRRWWKFW